MADFEHDILFLNINVPNAAGLQLIFEGEQRVMSVEVSRLRLPYSLK